MLACKADHTRVPAVLGGTDEVGGPGSAFESCMGAPGARGLVSFIHAGTVAPRPLPAIGANGLHARHDYIYLTVIS